MDPRLEELIEEGEGAEEVEVILKLRQGDIIPPHVRIITQFGNIATCRLRRDQIRTTWEHPSTVSVKGSRYVAAEPEFVEGGEALDTGNHPSDSRRPDSMEVTGRNVVIGIVDWGLDVGHLNFRRDDDSTRLLALWDQGNTTAIEKPAPYGYGAVYSPDEINRALQSPRPYETLGYHPADSDPLGYGTHGTHVCDIAAGNGRVEGSPLGIAPEADIVFVHLAARGTGGLANLGDSVRILEALDFIARIAGNRPWVVNLSLGRCGGPHTGLTLVEQGMDALLLHAPGRAICMSTGNYFDERVHTAGQLRPGQKHTLTWWTNKADITPNELECWYSGHDVFTVEVRPPEGNVVSHVPLGGQRSIQSDGKEVGRIYHRARDPGMGDNHIDIFLYPGAPSGSWLVTLIGEDIVDGRFHCWVERDNPCPQCQSRFDPQDAVPTSTIGTICNGFRTIAVGAYNPHSPDLEVAIFSSSGPTADGRQKPDLIAPGVRILAARSSSRNQHIEAPMLTRKSGTSMASPHVTGTLACMFEAAQRPLWIHETRKLLLSTCTTVSGPPEIAVRMGNGYLDIKKAVDAARIFTNEEQNSDRKIGKDVVMNGNDEYSRGEELEDELFNENKEGEDEEYEEYVEEDDDEYGETSKERNFILISGGPGLFDDRDVEHDKSWANYVTPPLLMTDTKEKRKKFAQDDEEVWWFVYKPAYESRWDDDLKQGRKSTKEVKDKGFTSYVNLIEKRAKDRDWNLRWLNAADDLWKKLKTFSKGSISRVWYWGHARDDLWLSLGHSSASEAIAPESHEIILVSSIDGNKKIRDRFQKGNSKRIHRFVGCNTSAFAQAWSKAFKVWTEGVEEKVDFADIHKTGGEPSLVGTAKIKFFSPKGIEADPTEAWQVEFAAAEDSWTEESDDELFESEEDNDKAEVSDICECKDDEEQDNEVFPEVRKNFGVALVELAEEAISTGNGILSGSALLHETLSKAGISEAASPLGVGSFLSAAEIFDTFATGRNLALQRHYEQFFEVVALPGSRLDEPLHGGDMIVRRALGEGRLAHLAIVATPELWSQNQLMERGLYGESDRPGFYVQVVEGGPRPHTLADSFARRVLDSRGRLYPDSVILRVVRRPHGIPIIEDEDIGYGENLEFGSADIIKAQKALKKLSKAGKSANDMTNFIFNQINPELKGRKLKETDRERLKNQWANIYYQIVLPFLGRPEKQPKFDYPDEVTARIERAVKQFDNAYEVLIGIKLKFPSVAEYDNHPEVLKSRTNANKTLFESLIPMVIEGLNLNKPDEIYKAVMALDEGRLIDTYVDIIAYTPALISDEERQQRYEGKKLSAIRIIKGAIEHHLDKRKPSDIQTGVEPKRAKDENIKAKAKPDNAKYNLTGRFEYINRADAQQPFGMVLCLNQAGNWIEGVLSIVGNPQKFADKPKLFCRFYTEIKDWSKPNPMIYIRGNLPAFLVNVRLEIQKADAIQILINEGPVNFKKVSGNPILTERHLAYFKDNPLVRQTQWFPLLSPQKANITSYFKDFTSYRPIHKFSKYNSLTADNRRLLNVRNLIVKAAGGDTDFLDILAGCLNQFIDENIHESDRDIAAFYIRNYLNENYFDKDGWKLTLLSWLYRQLRISKKYNYSNFVKFIYGDKAGDRITPADNQLYQYEIEVEVSGFGIGYFIKGGYYRGDIKIRCKQWEELGAKNADGSKKAKLRIHFGELGGGFVKSLNFGQSFSGVAESDVLWMPADFVGLISIMKADAEVGANITKIRKKLGISAGIGGTMGLMEIIGDSNLPPLNFGIYSLSGVVGGVEPKPHQEEGVGAEATGSVAIGSIWKDGALPVPKDIIKYGSEETVLKTAYQGDGRAHFKHDSALLTPAAENLIRKLCANEMFLLMSPKTVIMITGHTDMSGTDTYNEGLSKNRAANVKQKIIDICGTEINAVIKEPLYKGEELAKKDPAKKYYDPRYRRVDIDINGEIVLSLVGE